MERQTEIGKAKRGLIMHIENDHFRTHSNRHQADGALGSMGRCGIALLLLGQVPQSLMGLFAG